MGGSAASTAFNDSWVLTEANGNSQGQSQTWAKSYDVGGGGGAADVRQTPDGGFVAAGWTKAFVGANTDMWLVRLDASGSILWQRSYGGAGRDEIEKLHLTPDGGYIGIGLSSSFGAGQHAPLVLKFDANGNVQWQKTYLHSGRDWGFDIVQTTDGGYVIPGMTDPCACGGTTQGTIIKIDAGGNIQWQKAYAGQSTFNSIQQTPDGGYVMGGATASFGVGGGDALVLKLDANGNTQWQKTYGSGGYDAAVIIQLTSDGGYILGGSTTSFGSGGTDAWLLKLNSDGSVAWEKAYGGAGYDDAQYIEQTPDGGYVVSGQTNTGSITGTDLWVFKTDASGNLVWQRSYDSGSPSDVALAVHPTSDGGYVVAGFSDPGCPSGCVPAPQPQRFTILKLKSDGSIDPSCPAGVGTSTAATVHNTTATVQNAPLTSGNFNASANNTNVTVTNTNAQATTLCSSSGVSAPPAIVSISPSSGIQGQTITNFTVNGNNFQAAAILSFNPSDITVNATPSPTISPTQIVASITIVNSAAISPHDVIVMNPDGQHATLSGGFTVTGQPAISVSPIQITFPPTLLGTTSTAVPVTISNPGTASLLILNISITPFPPFATTGTLPTGIAIAPGGSANFGVNFSPNGTGPFSGSLTIMSNAPTSPTVISLQGTVVIPAPSIVSISPSSGFQGQTISNFTVTGASFDPAAILSFSGTGIAVNSYSSRTAVQIIANITIISPTIGGPRDVIVTNPDSQQAILNGSFLVSTGFLRFPLKATSPGVDENLNPYNVLINSVFDHSMRNSKGDYSIYGCDSTVTAYTGELGNLDPSSLDIVSGFKIGCKQGYEQDAFDTSFYVDGHYTGGGDTTHLYYDGHPGIDYRAFFGTQVYAAVKGTVRYPTKPDLVKQNITIGGNPDLFNVLELDPGNGYKIYYLHLSTHPRTISIHLTGDATGQDFFATRTGTPSPSTPGTVPKIAHLVISGKVTLGGQPLSGVQVELFGITEAGACATIPVAATDKNGNYGFVGLSAGFYHIRPFLDGYSFQPANPSIIVQDGSSVDAGSLIGLTGNAGNCLPPHFHFEVQKKTTPSVFASTSLAFVPVDAYGWDGNQDPYELVPGVKNDNLWGFEPLVDNINPQQVSAGVFDLSIGGKGFDSAAKVCLIRQGSDYSNPSCVPGVIQNLTDRQILVRENLVSGTYFVHVENSDGHRSNWKKLAVQ